MRIDRRASDSIRSVGTPTLTAFFAAMFVSLAAVQACGQTKPRVDRLGPCCSIVSIDGVARTATAKNTATGQLVTFSVLDKTMLQGLRVGQAVYFDSETQKVSLNYGAPCCGVVQVSGGAVGGAQVGVTAPLPPSEARAAATSAVGEASPHQPAPGGPCCNIVVDAALNSHVGRIAANFPPESDISASVDVFKAGTNERVGGWFTSGNLDVPPGTYDVKITNKLVRGVVVQGGHDTEVKVGAIRVKDQNALADILDSDAKTKVTGGYAPAVGLPPGTYYVHTGAVTDKVVVQAGKVTEW
ncbi:MAG: hypothetical protein ACREMS_08100 [Gemmatimonadaceae bacterium]